MARERGDTGQQSLNREEMLHLGIQTAKSGNKQSARVIFQQVLDQDPRNERALVWMASLATSLEDKRTYLFKTLRVNPDNETARRELQRIARTEKVSSNRTLIYGGVAVIAAFLLVLLVVLVVMVVTA